MSNYCVKLNLSPITHDQKQQLLDCWHANLDNVVQVGATDDTNDNLDIKKVDKDTISKYGFFYLYNWLNKKNDINAIFENVNIIKEYLHNLCIQKVTCGIEPHSDLNRTVTLLCILQGPADTVFYETENFVSGMSYRNKVNELEKIETHNLELNHWYLFNTCAIHSVENPQSERIGVVIDLTNHYSNFEDAVAKFSNKLTSSTY